MAEHPQGQASSASGPLGDLWAHAASCAILVLIGAALFAPVSTFDFVHYDDYELLVTHSGSLASWTSAARAFWHDAFATLGPRANGVYYRPLLIATYVVEAHLGGTSPLLYHVTNAACTCWRRVLPMCSS